MPNINKHKNPFAKFLYILWGTGILLLAYLCIPFFEKESGLYLGDLIANKNVTKPLRSNRTEGPKQNTDNEALFFVTINKKQFLTKFVTYISDDELSDKNRKDSLPESEEKNYIQIGRNKKQKKSTPKDFSIKAAPKI